MWLYKYLSTNQTSAYKSFHNPIFIPWEIITKTVSKKNTTVYICKEHMGKLVFMVIELIYFHQEIALMHISYNFGSDTTKIHDKPTFGQEMRSQHGE